MQGAGGGRRAEAFRGDLQRPELPAGLGGLCVAREEFKGCQPGHGAEQLSGRPSIPLLYSFNTVQYLHSHSTHILVIQSSLRPFLIDNLIGNGSGSFRPLQGPLPL